MGTLGRILLAVAWLAVVAAIALGAAGLVNGIDHQPSGAGRPELTWASDRVVGPALDAGAAELNGIAQQVDALGVEGRRALAAMNGRDVSTLERALDTGDGLVAELKRRSAAIRTTLGTIPGTSGPDAQVRLSPTLQARRARLLAAVDATGGLDTAWLRLRNGALAAGRLSKVLTDHDRITAEAASAGRAGEYRRARDRIDDAAVQLATARKMRDELANTVDVSTLTSWIDRNAAYDTALGRLYDALIRSGGSPNAAVRSATDDVEAAQKRLPPDARALVIVMGEIGEAGLNGAVITIEEARGRIRAALAAPPAANEDQAAP
ncbi:MAG: hypothetical protein ACJ761_09600 [Chloroflexota bacterium]